MPGGKGGMNDGTVGSDSATLERWLTGPRFAALPTRDAAQRPPSLSFEFFPPKTEALEQQLWTCIRRLEPLQPRFVSVTYGAGGTTRQRTHATVARIVQETALVPAAHLTCVGAVCAEVDEVARQYWDAGCAISWHCGAILLQGRPIARIPTAMHSRWTLLPG